MKVKAMLVAWVLVYGAAGLLIGGDARLSALNGEMRKPVPRAAKDTFEQLRVRPTEQSINVAARLSFDTAVARRNEADRKLRAARTEKRKHPIISFRSADPKGQTAPAPANKSVSSDRKPKRNRKLAKYFDKSDHSLQKYENIKFQRNGPSARPNPVAKERKLFMGPGDEEKRASQFVRFGQIYQNAVSRAQTKYSVNEHLNGWSKDSVDEIHRLYLSGMREVQTSRDFLLDKMEDIYNNFITPVRWNT